jgi:hypothetical protein
VVFDVNKSERASALIFEIPGVETPHSLFELIQIHELKLVAILGPRRY